MRAPPKTEADTSNVSLEEWQQNLMVAIRTLGPDEAVRHLAGATHQASPYLRRGLGAYRSHATLQSAKTLAVVYPVLSNILGEYDFAGLVRSFWRACPPQRGDLGQWGAAMAAHIESLPELAAAEPYLADVARLEWAQHEAERAADAKVDPESFDLLVREDPERLVLTLAPGAGCLQSRWPVVSIIEAHGQTPARAAQQPGAEQAETAIYWRKVWRAHVRQAKAGEGAFVRAVIDGAPVTVALERASNLDFAAWLPAAFGEGLLIGVRQVGKASSLGSQHPRQCQQGPTS